VRRFLPSPSTASPARRFEGQATFTDPTATTDGFWEQTWIDCGPGDLDWHDPLIQVQFSDDAGESWAGALDHGRRVDDQGWSLAVTHLGPVSDRGPEGAHRYRVRWFEPVHHFGRMHRFVLVDNAERPETAGPAFD